MTAHVTIGVTQRQVTLITDALHTAATVDRRTDGGEARVIELEHLADLVCEAAVTATEHSRPHDQETTP